MSCCKKEIKNLKDEIEGLKDDINFLNKILYKLRKNESKTFDLAYESNVKADLMLESKGLKYENFQLIKK